MSVRRSAVLGVACAAMVMVASVAPAQADEDWQHEVRLRPDSVEAILTMRGDESAVGADVAGPPPVDTSEFRVVTVTHDDGGGCQSDGAVLVTMTGTRADGTEQTVLSQCEVSRVGSAEAYEAAQRMARQLAKLRLPTAGFDPKVRGLVGLRTWLHVAPPTESLVSAAVNGYDLRAVARPLAVEVTLDDVKQPVRLRPDPSAPTDAVGPFVFTRSGRHHLTVRVMWIAEWALLDPGGAPVRFGITSTVPGTSVSSDYVVVQAQARLR